MQRRLCEMSEAKWSITEAKCLQRSHNNTHPSGMRFRIQWGNLMLSHSAGMHNTDKSIAGICPNKFERAKGSKRFNFASLHYIFSAYLPTHIKFLTEFRSIFFGTTGISKKIIRGNLCCPCSLDSATDLHKFPRIIFVDGWLLVEDKGDE